jgi:hypothetical protein
MSDFHFITYATHSEGSFEELTNNKYNIPIKVLGWGEKWNGFMDKFKNMYSYIETLPDEDVVFFIDGFDSVINQPLDVIKKRFYEFNSEIILSLDPAPFGVLSINSFGICKNDLVANSGLYAGYNKDVKQLIKYILDKNYSSDDQRNLNEACKYFKNIVIDTEKKLFDNQTYYDRYLKYKSESCFVSTPGALTFNRLKRAPGEYLPFLWKELVSLIFVLIIIYFIYKNKKKLYVKLLNIFK